MCNKNSTNTSKSSLPTYLETTYKSLLNAGAKAAARPDVSYQGSTVAGFTPMQNQAYQQIQNTQGNWTPYINNASSMLANAYNMFTPQNYGSTISQYQNPYTQQVVDSTMANINRNNAIQQTQLAGQGAASGVSPNLGDRLGVASAELARNQALASNQTVAGLEQQGYTNAQQAAQSAGNFGQQDAGSMANLGQQVQNQTGTGIGQLMNAGAQQQALQQQQLTNAYNQFQQQQQYPQQQIDWLASLAYGQPKGGTTTTTAQGPSALSTIAGLATAGAGLFGNNGLFSSGGIFGSPTNSGGIPQGYGATQAAAGQSSGGSVHNHGDIRLSHKAPGGPSVTPSTPTPITAPQVDQSIYTAPPTAAYDNTAPDLAPIKPHTEYWNTAADPWISWASKGMSEPFSGSKYVMTRSANPLVPITQMPIWPMDPHTMESNIGLGKTGTFTQYSGGGKARSFAHMDTGGDPAPPQSVSDWMSGTNFDGTDAAADTLPAQPPPQPTASFGTGPMTYGGGPGPSRPYGGFLQNSGFPLLTMGLGMMGNPSPFPGVAIGAGALEGLKLPSEMARTQMELDAHPIVDSSTGHIMVYYPSEGRWVDTGMKSIQGQKWEMEQPALQAGWRQATDSLIPGYSATHGGDGTGTSGSGNSFDPANTTTGGGGYGTAIKSGILADMGMQPSVIAEQTKPQLGPDFWGAQSQDYITSAAKAESMKQDIDAMRTLLQNAPQGFGANEINHIKSIGASLFPNYDWGKVNNSQAFPTLVKGILAPLRQETFGGNRTTNMDVKLLYGMLPQLENTPGGNAVILDYLDKIANQNIAIKDVYQGYAEARPGRSVIQLEDGTKIPINKQVSEGNIDGGLTSAVIAYQQQHQIFPPGEIERALKSAKSSPTPLGGTPNIANASSTGSGSFSPRSGPRYIDASNHFTDSFSHAATDTEKQKLVQYFDAVYGPGAAESILSQGGP